MEGITGTLIFWRHSSLHRFSLTLCLLLAFVHANAQLQQVIGSAGDSYEAGVLAVDFTLGEVVIDSYTGGNNLTSGFHQPEISLSRLPSHEAIDILVYPNPTRSQLTIWSSQALAIDLSLSDVFGHKVLEHTMSDTRTTLDIEYLPAGNYILSLRCAKGSTTRLISKVR